MSHTDADRPPVSLPLLALLFFGSGLTALVYELVWLRRLQLVFGSTTYSVTTVLAAFMAGLGIGSYLIGRRVDQRPDGGYRTYALLELGVASYAIISLPLLAGVEQIYAVLQSWLQVGQLPAALIKFLLAFPVLAVPAGMMGGTLPALVRAIVRHRATLPRQVGWLYGVNTIGAAAGTLLTGMLLIEALGLWRTIAIAAAVNLSIALVVLRCLKRAEQARAARKRITPADEEPAAAPARPPEHMRLRQHLRRPAVLFCAVAVVLTGMLAMSYEVVWTRLLSLVMGSSTYAFTLVLGVFLLGIAGGSLIFARATAKRQPTAFGLALLLLALALWATISLALLPVLPELLAWAAQLPGLTFGRLLVLESVFALALLLVPTLLLGAALPMAMGVISRAVGLVGRDVGGVYLANTAGAIAGSVLTGFALIPLWGTRATLLIGLSANLALAGVGLLAFGNYGPRRAMGLLLTVLVAGLALSQPPWPARAFDAGLGYRLDNLHARSKLELERKLHRTPNKLLFRREGVNATISVRQFPEGTTLLVNGKPDASSSGDMSTQAVLGVVGMMAHERPRDVNVVGWGSGVTAYMTTFFPTVRRVDVVEIERAVVEASPFFHTVNGRVEDNDKLRVIYDDARSYFLTTKQAYDVIISEPSNPWMTGVSALFSRDYYELAKRRLRRDGVFAQWLQLYRIDAYSIAMMLRTLLESFTDVQLWYSDRGNVLLLASMQPLRASYERARRLYRSEPRIPLHMSAYGPGPRPEHLFGCFLLDRPALEQIVRRFDVPVLTDDHPVLEYRAVRNLRQTNHPHIDSFVKMKLERAALLPPLHGKPPSAGVVLAGAARILRGEQALSQRLTQWGMARFGDEPEVQLARAKVLLRAGDVAGARRLVAALPAVQPWPAEAALLEGRAQLQSGRPAAALDSLARMGAYRPTARRLYQLRAALAAGQLDRAWSLLVELLQGLSADDPDARQLQLNQLYEREVQQLLQRSRRLDRAVRLLTRSFAPHAGEVHRLALLFDVYLHSQRIRDAARVLDQLRSFNLLQPRLLRMCESLYRKAGQYGKIAACQAQRRKLLDEPVGPPLW